MTDIDDLVMRLRSYITGRSTLFEAADALEAQAKQLSYFGGTVEVLAVENEKLKNRIAEFETALQKVAAVEYGYQSLLDEYPDANAQNYHARNFWFETADRYKTIARTALHQTE
jgi:hypothetical protein